MFKKEDVFGIVRKSLFLHNYLNLKDLSYISAGFIKKALTNNGLYVKKEKIGYTTGYGFNVGQKGGDEHKNSPKSYINPVI